MADNFLRFVRGTSAAFNKIINKDKDTLYFVSEKEAKTGTLYLGDKLIGGNGLVSASNLNELQNVSITDPVQSGSILVYNSETEKWESKDADAFTSSGYYTMIGASETSDGESGFVPKPLKADKDLFLKGDGTWANPVGDLNSKLNTLIGDDADKSVRAIALEAVKTALIPGAAKEELDTLQEIGEWIQSHTDTITDGDIVAKVSQLDKIINDQPDPEDETKTVLGLQTIVQNFITSTGDELTNINNKIDNINERLKWEEMNEE